MSRSKVDWHKLQLAAAECFENGYSPFNHDFLTEHDVTATECMELSSQISTLLNAYAMSPGWIQTLIFAAGVLVELGRGAVENVWNLGIHQHSLDCLAAMDDLRGRGKQEEEV